MLVGFSGTEIEPYLGTTVDRIRPGGIIFFQRNVSTPKQTLDLLRSAQERNFSLTGVPLFMAVDQEGGNVVRIKSGPPLPSALALGGTKDEGLVKRAGRGVGKALKALGFNMNLAPVLDVNDSQKANFIGTRAFGSDPKIVSRMGAAFSLGLQDSGILPTAKHFPGHGGLSVDSHVKTGVKDSSVEGMWSHDLEPYRQLQKKLRHPWAIMLAHVAYPKLDPSGVPATFSKSIISKLLRKEMKFKGLVITDDLDMGGAQIAGDLGNRAVRSLQAGADMIMVSWGLKQQQQVLRAIVKAVKSGKLPEARINESLQRILAAKKIYINDFLMNRTDEEVLEALRNQDLVEISRATIKRTFERAAVSWSEKRKPASVDGEVFVISDSRKFYDSFSTIRRDAKYIELNPAKPNDIAHLLRENVKSTAVLYVSGKKMAEWASSLSPEVAGRVVVVNAETRDLLSNGDNFQYIIDVNYRHPSLGRLTAEHFFPAKTSR